MQPIARQLGRVACALGLHAWRIWDRWEPSILAPIVTRYTFGRTCQRPHCRRDEALTDLRYDPTTGAPIRAPAACAIPDNCRG